MGKTSLVDFDSTYRLARSRLLQPVFSHSMPPLQRALVSDRRNCRLRIKSQHTRSVSTWSYTFSISGMLIERRMKAFYAIMLLIYLDLGVIKISFILFYKRLFAIPPFRIVCNVMIAVITGWTIAQFIVGSSTCFSFIALRAHETRSKRSIPGISPDSGTRNF